MDKNTLFFKLATVCGLLGLFILFNGLVSSAEALVDINTAGTTELASLPGVSESAAKAIVDYRSSHGPFSDIGQLVKVKGIGKKTVEKIKHLITVDSSGIVPAMGSNTGKPSKPPIDVSKVLSAFSHEPSIKEVQEAAIKHAQIHPEDIDKWRERIHTRVFLPETKFKVDYYTRENSTVRTQENIDFRDTPDRYIQGPDEHTYTNYDYDYVKYQLQFTWDFHELLFNRDELRIRNESEDLVDFRTKVVEDVTKLYFERRRLQITNLLSPVSDPRLQIEKNLRMQELTALIDMMTGGFFTEQMKQRSKTSH